MGIALSRLGRLAVGAFDGALSELFQTACLGCGALCARPLCGRCYWHPWLPEQAGSPVQSALAYRTPWREVLHAIKFKRQRELLRLFQPVVEASDFGFVVPDAVVVPVPVHHATLRTRGFNQSERLAGWVARHAALPILVDKLSKQRRTRAQSTLDEQERARNLVGSFRWRGHGSAPNAVLLVDDVYTTGATFAACSDALQKAGVNRVQLWTVFRAKEPAKLTNSP